MPGDVRFVAPVDEILTTFGLAYIQNRARYFAADDLFPYVEFEGYNGTIYVDEARSTLHAGSARAGDEIGYPTVSFRGKGIPFMAEDWGFQSLITNKQRLSQQVPGSSIEMRRARSLTERLWLAREVRANAIAAAISDNVSLGGTKWNTASAVPRTDIMTGKKTVLQFTGREPNKIVLTGTVADDLISRDGPAGSAGQLLKDAIKYVMAATGRQLNEPLIAAYFDVEMVRFARGIQGTAAATPTVEGSLSTQGSYIFTGDRAYLFFNEDASPETSNFGVSPGPMYYGSRQLADPYGRGTWVQCFQALIEFTAEAKSMYVVGTIL